MITELFLYDRDKGLFKEILKQSKVIQGRYHVAPNYGQELNTANLDSYIKDPASGLSDAKQKYPCAVCMPPRSNIRKIEGGLMEEYVFTIYFLTLNKRTGDGQIKSLDKDTNTSSHHVWYDWNDMNSAAINFISMLGKVPKMKVDNVPLGRYLVVDYDGAGINRLSKYGNDSVSGVGVTFQVSLRKEACELTDYESDAIDLITIPEFE